MKGRATDHLETLDAANAKPVFERVGEKLMDLSLDITTLREGYLSRAHTARDVIGEVVRRIERGDPSIWISVDSRDRLLEQAKALESVDPSSLPLYGIPFAVNDNIDVASLPTTAGCPDFRYFASEDSAVVARLRAAGAIPIGKTNLEPFAGGLLGILSPYGTPRNAFDAAFIPGGSSSGAAVSVALGQVSFSLGTDTDGGGIIPAGFNNLIGLKPSRGLISNAGVVHGCRSLDCVSPMTLNAADAQAVFRIAASFDEADPYSRLYPTNLDTPHRAYREGMVFGAPLPQQLQFFGNVAYQELYLESLARLEKLGFQRKTIDFFPFLAAARLQREGPWTAERYGAIRDLLEQSPDSLRPLTRSMLEKGANSSALDVFEAMHSLRSLQQLACLALNAVDFLVTPSAGTIYTTAEAEADPLRLNSNLGYYTGCVNLLDLCAVTSPAGFTASKLPFGVALIAPAFHEEKLLRVASELQRASDQPWGATERKHATSFAPSRFDSLPMVVCGARMSGGPLNYQLTELGAVFGRSTQTSPNYRLFAPTEAPNAEAALIRDVANGVAIDVEIWNLPKSQWAAYLEQVGPPMCIGSVELMDGDVAKGLLCEAWAVADAKELTQAGD